MQTSGDLVHPSHQFQGNPGTIVHQSQEALSVKGRIGILNAIRQGS
jgi:ribosomal protein L21E